jgi:hypothetical protein
MSIRNAVRDVVVNLLIERPARKRSLAELIASLEASAQQIDRRMAECQADEPKNLETMRHIIGIERWGQQRLRSFLGEPLTRDEYNGYRPDDVADMAGLRRAFAATRVDTVQLAQRLREHEVADAATVAHNDMGDLTARGWLRYLNSHANLESRRLK